ncbi:MAG: hypothetical protein ACOC0E_13015 [Spirochaetota bacterium]
MRTANLITMTAATALVLSLGLSGCIFILDPEAAGDWNADLQIEAYWDEGDVDLYVSYPKPKDGDTTAGDGDPEFTGLYDDFDDHPGPATGNLGFYVDDADHREIVSPNDRTSTFTASGAHSVEMTKESGDGGPEVVIIRRPPFDYSDLQYRTSPESSLGLDGHDEFAWIGVGEVYVNGDGIDLNDADVSVDVYLKDSLLATLDLPSDLNGIESMSVARIHYFKARDPSGTYDYYVVAPDIRVEMGTSSFRGISDGVVYGDGAIGVRGRKTE